MWDILYKIWQFLVGLAPKPIIPAPAPMPPAPIPPVVPEPTPPTAPGPVHMSDEMDWSTAASSRHSLRVLCDKADMAVGDKNVLCGVVGGESGWMNYYPADYHIAALRGKPVTRWNPPTPHIPEGSTDWGICQINDHYHIGPGKDFPSVEYVLANPEKVVKWMIGMYKAGLIKLWVAYTSGRYRQFM